MICLYNGKILFDLAFQNILLMSLDISDLVINDEVILPITINYLSAVTTPDIKKFYNSRLPKSIEHVAIGINSNKEIFLYSKIEQECIKIQIPTSASLLINDSNATPENIFICNIKDYKLNNFTIPQIIEDLASKTPYIDKPMDGYIASIEDLSNKCFSNLKPFIKEKSLVIGYQLNQLENI